MEPILPLFVGLLSAGALGLAWRAWSHRHDAKAPFDDRPSLTALPGTAVDAPTRGWINRDAAVARMRDRPLAEVGVGRALPRTARTTGICPRCGRTLDRGRRRCAGCGAWLVDGIPARRAGAFVARGAAIGVLIGLFGGLMLASLGGRASSDGVGWATRAPDRSLGPAPAGVRAALDGMLAVGSRLAAARDGLAAALAEPAPDVATLTGQLRAVDAEAAEGLALTAALDRWDGSRVLASDLRSFQVAVREAAAPGLRGDVAAARAAGTAVLESLTPLEVLNARMVVSAREVGLLPPAPPRAASPVPSAAPPAPASAGPSPSGG